MFTYNTENKTKNWTENEIKSAAVNAGENQSKSAAVNAGENQSKSAAVNAGENQSKSAAVNAGENQSKSAAVNAGENQSKSAAVNARENQSKSAAVNARENQSKSTAENVEDNESKSVADNNTLHQSELYMETVLSHIRCKKAKTGIEKEIKAHIEDQKENFLKKGFTAREAENLAVLEMGDPDEVGESLDRIHKPKTDYSILLMVAALSIFGIIMQSIIFLFTEDSMHRDMYIQNTIANNLIGCILMMLVFFFDYRKLAKYIWGLYFVYIGISVLLLRLALFRDYAASLRMGNVIWLLYLPVFCAFIYRFHKQKLTGVIKTLGMLVLNSVLMVMVGAQSVSVWFVVQTACILTLLIALFAGFYTKDRKMQIAVSGAIVLLCVLGAFFAYNGMAAYVQARLYAILHPREYADGMNYVSSNIRDLIETTGIMGEHNLRFLDTLPGAHSEYIVTSVFQYFGWFMAGMVIALILGLFVRCLYVTCRQDNPFGFLLGLGLGITLVFKSVLYILANLGIAPGTAIDLPFMSYGLSAAMCNYLYMGLILAVHRYGAVFGSDMPEIKILRFQIQKSKL